MKNYIKSFFGLYQNPILLFIINNYYLRFRSKVNDGTFKPGDKVKYNWMAMVVLSESYILSKTGENLFTVKDYPEWSKSKGNIEFTEGECQDRAGNTYYNGCSCFWISKIKEKRVVFIFTWYDMWVGFFWDSKKRWLYVFPLPMMGVIIKFK